MSASRLWAVAAVAAAAPAAVAVGGVVVAVGSAGPDRAAALLLAAAGAVGLLTVIAAAVWWQRRVLRPLREIARGRTAPHEHRDDALGAVARALALSQARLDDASLRDPETGVYAAGELRVRRAAEVARAQRYDRPLSAILLAVDATTVRSAALAVAAALRPTDIVGRPAPDRLEVLLPETPPEAAEQVARRLLATLPDGTRAAVVGVEDTPAGADQLHTALSGLLASAAPGEVLRYGAAPTPRRGAP